MRQPDREAGGGQVLFERQVAVVFGVAEQMS